MCRASPSFFSAQMPYQLSVDFVPRQAMTRRDRMRMMIVVPAFAKGQDATRKLLVERSLVAKRRDPHMCVTEFTIQVACSPTTTRANTPHSSHGNPPMA
jgi:hypothetical protein